MGWTRNLGLQKSEDIAAALEATTWEKIEAKTGGGDVIEHRHDMLLASERALMAPVVAAAKAGVEEFGGEAFVHVQAQNRIIMRQATGDKDVPVGEAKAVRVKCIVVTLTTETDIEEKT